MPSSPTHTFRKNNSPTHRKWTFLLNWNFFRTTITSEIESRLSSIMFDCTKTSKKNLEYYSRDYFPLLKVSTIIFFNAYTINELIRTVKAPRTDPLSEHVLNELIQLLTPTTKLAFSRTEPKSIYLQIVKSPMVKRLCSISKLSHSSHLTREGVILPTKQ